MNTNLTVQMVFKNFNVLVPLMKVASASKGLRQFSLILIGVIVPALAQVQHLQWYSMQVETYLAFFWLHSKNKKGTTILSMFFWSQNKTKMGNHISPDEKI